MDVLSAFQQTSAARLDFYSLRKGNWHQGEAMTEGKKPDFQGQDQKHSRYYSPALLPLIQSLLATLANMEFEFERECEKVRGTTDIQLKARVLERLRAQHQARREPYLRELARLQKQAFEGERQASVA